MVSTSLMVDTITVPPRPILLCAPNCALTEQLLVSVSSVSKVLGRERRTGERTVRPQRGHVTPKLAAYHDAIREYVLANPDVTLAELQAWLCEAHDLSA